MSTAAIRRSFSGALAFILANVASPAMAQQEIGAPGAAAGAGAAAENHERAAPGSAGAVGVAGTEGELGIALSLDGRSRLHLGIDAGVGIDTNPFSIPLYQPGFAGDAIIRVRPNASITYPGSVISFDADGSVDVGFLPGAFSANTRIGNVPLLFQTGVAAALELNRGGLFSFGLGDTLSFDRDPGLLAIGTTINRLSNDLRGAVGIRPGGGTVGIKLGSHFAVTKYLDVDSTGGVLGAGVFDNYTIAGELRVDWRFLPRTGVYGDISAGYNNYFLSGVNPASFPIAVNLGLMGQFTPKLTGLVQIGYQNPMTLDTDANGNLGIRTGNLLGLAGQAEIQWAFAPSGKLAGGIQRTIAPTPLYQFAGNNRVYAEYDQRIAGKLALALNAGYSLLQFGEEQDISGKGVALTDRPNGDRIDNRVDVSAQISYFVLDWLSFAVFNRFTGTFTNANLIADGTNVGNLSYIRNETMLLASILY